MHSMTGFGRAEGPVGNHHYAVEVKSVNHRYLDVRFRAPSALSLYEIPLTDLLRQHFERGSFELNIKPKAPTGQSVVAGSTRFVIDEVAMKSLMEGIAWLHQKYQTVPIPSLELLADTNRIFIAVEDSLDTSTTLQEVKSLVETALKDLQKMRETEGARLKQILREGAEALLKTADQLAQLAPEHPIRIREKLNQRIAQLKMSTSPDAQRLEWEVAFFADRADITEEIDRLRTHANEFITLLGNPRSVGRKLDFLTQELHREVNTVGSKANLLEITKLSVEAKTTIEKLREQVQNVE